jgi:hypothetical protein
MSKNPRQFWFEDGSGFGSAALLVLTLLVSLGLATGVALYSSGTPEPTGISIMAAKEYWAAYIAVAGAGVSVIGYLLTRKVSLAQDRVLEDQQELLRKSNEKLQENTKAIEEQKRRHEQSTRANQFFRIDKISTARTEEHINKVFYCCRTEDRAHKVIPYTPVTEDTAVAALSGILRDCGGWSIAMRGHNENGVLHDKDDGRLKDHPALMFFSTAVANTVLDNQLAQKGMPRFWVQGTSILEDGAATKWTDQLEGTHFGILARITVAGRPVFVLTGPSSAGAAIAGRMVECLIEHGEALAYSSTLGAQMQKDDIKKVTESDDDFIALLEGEFWPHYVGVKQVRTIRVVSGKDVFCERAAPTQEKSAALTPPTPPPA